jgi:hypothetical protein
VASNRRLTRCRPLDKGPFYGLLFKLNNALDQIPAPSARFIYLARISLDTTEIKQLFASD